MVFGSVSRSVVHVHVWTETLVNPNHPDKSQGTDVPRQRGPHARGQHRVGDGLLSVEKDSALWVSFAVSWARRPSVRSGGGWRPPMRRKIDAIFNQHPHTSYICTDLGRRLHHLGRGAAPERADAPLLVHVLERLDRRLLAEAPHPRLPHLEGHAQRGGLGALFVCVVGGLCGYG